LIVLVLLRVYLPHCSLHTGWLHALTEVLLPLHYSHILLNEEVSHPKTINIQHFLSTHNISVNNRHVVIKSSQATQLYITDYEN
jgi:hypothetical protein